MAKNPTVVYKCQPTGNEVIPDLEIVATEAIPRAPDVSERFYRPALGRVFTNDAEKIVNALTASLPGGTLDRVLAIMLQRKASIYVVRDEGMRQADNICDLGNKAYVMEHCRQSLAFQIGVPVQELSSRIVADLVILGEGMFMSETSHQAVKDAIARIEKEFDENAQLGS